MAPSKTHIRLPTHNVHCEVKEHKIFIFKFNDHGCDYEVFADWDQLAASDYIIDPLPQIHYRVTFPGEIG